MNRLWLVSLIVLGVVVACHGPPNVVDVGTAPTAPAVRGSGPGGALLPEEAAAWQTKLIAAQGKVQRLQSQQDNQNRDDTRLWWAGAGLMLVAVLGFAAVSYFKAQIPILPGPTIFLGMFGLGLLFLFLPSLRGSPWFIEIFGAMLLAIFALMAVAAIWHNRALFNATPPKAA